MAELFDMKELEERVILVAVSTSDEDDTEASLDELEELADTAGATAIGRLVQNREKIHPGTYLGSGKIGELREMVWAAAWMRANSSRSYSWGRCTHPVNSPPAPDPVCSFLWACFKRGSRAFL